MRSIRSCRAAFPATFGPAINRCDVMSSSKCGHVIRNDGVACSSHASGTTPSVQSEIRIRGKAPRLELPRKFRGLWPAGHRAFGPIEHIGCSQRVVQRLNSLKAQFAATRCRCCWWRNVQVNWKYLRCSSQESGTSAALKRRRPVKEGGCLPSTIAVTMSGASQFSRSSCQR
jgi:hypothetical protein